MANGPDPTFDFSKQKFQKTEVDEFTDSQRSMLSGIPKSAMCVQRFDDSLNSAIHITYRISLRSSSLREPRDPLSKVVFKFNLKDQIQVSQNNILQKVCTKRRQSNVGKPKNRENLSRYPWLLGTRDTRTAKDRYGAHKCF